MELSSCAGTFALLPVDAGGRCYKSKHNQGAALMFDRLYSPGALSQTQSCYMLCFSHSCSEKQAGTGSFLVGLGDRHLCADWTSLGRPSIHHHLFHPSSVNGHLFLIRLAGGAGAFPSSRGVRGKDTPRKGCQSKRTRSPRCVVGSSAFQVLGGGRKLEKTPLPPVVPLN